ncbi:MAG: DUF2520 domain-containing protein [Deltaproteobacteria bacterium]|nr:DUF2520 domain-containing protein [Deltaproteobacteria bacterium]
MKQHIALVGPGRVGCAITKSLYRAGYPISAVIGRDRHKAISACEFIGCSTELASVELTNIPATEIILLAVPDDQIVISAQRLQGMNELPESTTLIHFSGLYPADIMRLTGTAIRLLSLHPLLPFADRQSAFDSLEHCPCALEGNASALALGEELIRAIGGQSFLLDGEKKALYHSSACIASNFLVTLIAWARDLLINCGIKSDQAIPLLMPLIQASIENIKTYGPEQGLTGPIVRGDVETVSKHIEALRKTSVNQRDTYLKLGELTLALAENSGRLNAELTQKLQTILSQEKPDQVTDNIS